MKSLLVKCVIVITIMFIIGITHGNSAPAIWRTTDASNTLIATEHSPLIVEHELLTFNIFSLPITYHYTEKDLPFNSTVIAEYTIYNPSDYTVNATLFFPLGNNPSYSYKFHDVYTVDSRSIMVDHQEIPLQLRYSYFDRRDDFNVRNDLSKLYDDYVQHYFYTPDLEVTKYTFEVTEAPTDYASYIDIAFDCSFTPNFKILFPDYHDVILLEDGTYRCRGRVKKKQEFYLYVIGEQFEDLEWTIYENDQVMDGHEIEGTVETVSIDEMTFKEFALTDYPNDSDILQSDWYNAIVYSLQNSRTISNVINPYQFHFDISNQLMQWYSYEITLHPKQRIINTVTAPIYPSLDARYDPPKYEYTYLLSPAKLWTEFNTLDIFINTPYHLLESSLDGFVKSDIGYQLELDSLPYGELNFILSSSAQPEQAKRQYIYTPESQYRDRNRRIISGIILFVVLFLVYRRRKKK